MNFFGGAAIVFGAGGGMGLTIANDLISAGADVTLADLKPRPDAIAEGPGSAAYHQGDASDEAFVVEVVAKAVAENGHLDYLVNTTGVLWFDRDTSLVDIDMAVWDQVFDINLKSHALTARHAIPHMKKTGGGAMVHISSIDALRGDGKPQDAYGASKAALTHMTNTIAREVDEYGISVLAYSPGFVRTAMADTVLSPNAHALVREKFNKIVEDGQVVPIERTVEKFMFLASGRADGLSGCLISVADDEVDLLRRADEIRRDDLYTVRLRT